MDMEGIGTDSPPGTPVQQLAVQMSVVVLETLFYGIFLVLFFAMGYIRLHSRNSTRLGFGASFGRSPVELALFALLLLSTTHWTITLISFFSTFLGPGRDSVAAMIHASRNSPSLLRLQSTQNMLTLLSMAVGDAVIIHRLWVVYTHNLRIVIAPLAFWAGLIVTGFYVVVRLYINLPNAHKTVSGWITANWVLSAATCVYCTTFLACRVWTTCRESPGKRTGKLMASLVVLVESAAIWTSWMLVYIVLHEVHTVVQLAFNACVTSLLGIVNTSIYLRIAVGVSAAPPRPRPRPQSGITITQTEMNTRAPGTELATMTNDASLFGLSAVSSDPESSEYGLEYQYPNPIDSRRSSSVKYSYSL
ncbi:hypothetical protein MIND_00263600 [Mycena indigotica]|uniref:Uncharacterized protein n=1 Tax=Mycena indigotica TaxID=2126181 RepID=A0A8H6T831_9AGAR|nr:uncharacterized protein MIND_00263600 [Mycena indigotica]KAF7312499.1 hypothetical protein MIND_00263600 [Mycena indigotica]